MGLSPMAPPARVCPPLQSLVTRWLHSHRGSLRVPVTPHPCLCWAPLCPQEAVVGVLHIVLGSGPIPPARLETPPRCDQPSAVQISHRDPQLSHPLQSPVPAPRCSSNPLPRPRGCWEVSLALSAGLPEGRLFSHSHGPVFPAELPRAGDASAAAPAWAALPAWASVAAGSPHPGRAA